MIHEEITLLTQTPSEDNLKELRHTLHTLACLPFANSTSRRTVIAASSTINFPALARFRPSCRCGSNYGSGVELIYRHILLPWMCRLGIFM